MESVKYFCCVCSTLLAYSGTIHEVNGKEIHSSWVIAIAFIIGAVFSATAGYIGMKVALLKLTFVRLKQLVQV
jgi:K(+)-stimulated pyrophosphate-energized sodium pump